MGNAARSGDAGNEADKYDRQVRIGHAHLKLVQNAAVKEYGKGVQEGAVALSRHTSRPGTHILLGDAHGQITVRINLAELLDLAGRTEVGGHNHDLRMLRGKADHIFFVGIDFNFHG